MQMLDMLQLLKGLSRRNFQTTRLLLNRWTGEEDALLLGRYEELGPAWTVISMGIRSRSPMECRRRWLILSGALEGLNAEEYRLVYVEGYERLNKRLVRVPMERIVASPFAKLASMIDQVRFRSQRKKGGWSQIERLAVWQGLDQYGPNWQLIADKMQYRTPQQCRNLMLRRFVSLGLFDKCLPEYKKYAQSLQTEDLDDGPMEPVAEGAK